jgi:hypothetical protein
MLTNFPRGAIILDVADDVTLSKRNAGVLELADRLD